MFYLIYLIYFVIICLLVIKKKKKKLGTRTTFKFKKKSWGPYFFLPRSGNIV